MAKMEQMLMLNHTCQTQLANLSELDRILENLLTPDNEEILKKAGFEINGKTQFSENLAERLLINAEKMKIKTDAIMEILQIESSKNSNRGSLELEEVERLQIETTSKLEKVLEANYTEKAKDIIETYNDYIKNDVTFPSSIEEAILQREYKLRVLTMSILTVQDKNKQTDKIGRS